VHALALDAEIAQQFVLAAGLLLQRGTLFSISAIARPRREDEELRIVRRRR
jgi:hypothetical protein